MSDLVHYRSPVGNLEIEGRAGCITAIRFVDAIPDTNGRVPAYLRVCVRQLKEYFQGRRKVFTVDVDFGDAPSFYEEVWRLVRMIPYGKTRCYSTIAHFLDRPNASRAVGQANGSNPIPIIVPCHRVLGKDGHLVGYAHGIEIKQALLELENPDTFHHQNELFETSLTASRA